MTAAAANGSGAHCHAVNIGRSMRYGAGVMQFKFGVACDMERVSIRHLACDLTRGTREDLMH